MMDILNDGYPEGWISWRMDVLKDGYRQGCNTSSPFWCVCSELMKSSKLWYTLGTPWKNTSLGVWYWYVPLVPPYRKSYYRTVDMLDIGLQILVCASFPWCISGCLVLMCYFSSASARKLLSHSGHFGHWSANSILCKFSLLHPLVFGTDMFL